MPKFGNPKGKRPPVATGKYSRHEVLPNRAALNQLTGGNPEQRSLGWYAKLVPTGSGALTTTYDDIVNLGLKK